MRLRDRADNRCLPQPLDLKAIKMKSLYDLYEMLKLSRLTESFEDQLLSPNVGYCVWMRTVFLGG